MSNYYQESQKMQKEGQSLMPSESLQHSGQPQYPPSQYPPSQYPPSQHPPSQYPPSQYPPSQYPPSQYPYPPPGSNFQQPYPPSQRPYPQSGYMQGDYSYSGLQTGYSAPVPHFPPQGPITNQPMGQGDANWMERPQAIPNCPPGLEYLASIDKLVIHQKLDLLELIANVEIENKYSIHNGLGQMVYHADEQSEVCMRNCCQSNRSFEMIISDNFGQEVLHFSRPYRCQGCCCFCCLQTMEVFSPPGNTIGTIEQNWNPIFPSFSLKNPSGDTILRIKGPFCTLPCCCSDIKFEIFSANGDFPIGEITKKWTGYAREVYTNADTFEITFSKDLDVKMKAVLLGSVFLIDMMYFEQPQNPNRR